MAIACIDLDQFAVDNTARAARATKPDGKIDWGLMFNSNLILELDQPIPQMVEALHGLKAKGHTIWYVTSRETKCETATVTWLRQNGYPDAANVICRPPFTKTIKFKAETVARLHKEQGPVVLFADNDAKNLEAVRALGIAGLEVQDYL